MTSSSSSLASDLNSVCFILAIYIILVHHCIALLSLSSCCAPTNCDTTATLYSSTSERIYPFTLLIAFALCCLFSLHLAMTAVMSFNVYHLMFSLQCKNWLRFYRANYAFAVAENEWQAVIGRRFVGRDGRRNNGNNSNSNSNSNTGSAQSPLLMILTME